MDDLARALGLEPARCQLGGGFGLCAVRVGRRGRWFAGRYR